MGGETSISLSKTLTLLIVLFFVVLQADCLGDRDQKQARLTSSLGSALSNNPATTTPAPVGKECTTDQDCSLVQNATCKKDAHGPKKRCLCADRTAPRYASCKHSKIGLHSRCNVTTDCIENATCKITNSTNSNNPSYLACTCKEGFEEEDHECNRGILTSVPGLFLILTFCLLQLTKYYKQTEI